MQEMEFPGFKISETPRPRGLQPFLSLSNISHRKVRCPPTGKSLKKALTSIPKKPYKMSVYILNLYF